jgi:hypothetical protein
MSVVTNTYSDQDMACPDAWENGFKEARILSSGDAERALSHPWTGEWTGSTFVFSLSDYDQKFRAQLAGVVDRFWIEPLTVRMTTRANRAALGIPWTVFVGPIIEARPSRPLAFDFTLGDIVSTTLLSNQHQVPWRMIGDGFLSLLDSVSDLLDLQTPEPIIYGRHIRVPGTVGSPPVASAASGEGFEVTPIYLGIRTVSGTPYHVWEIAGHACADVISLAHTIPDGARTDVTGEGTDWLIPHFANYLAEFGAPYEDIVSDTYPDTTRRHTTLYGKVGEAAPDACAAGEEILTAAVEGVEPSAIGSSEVELDRLQQYKHFIINYVANHGKQSYQSGDWLTTPNWDAFGVTVPIVDEDSFDACTAIANQRFPTTGSPFVPGYVGAAVIGARSGDRRSVLRWIADWNRSCGTRFGITHWGRIKITMLHPTVAAKAAAVLYTDATEILNQSFGTEILFADHVTEVPFRGDFEHRTGRWMTNDVATEGNAEELYGRDIPSEMREYPFAPGITALNHLAILELRQRWHPPKLVKLSAAIGPDNDGDSLAYRELGDYIKYRAYPAIAEAPSDIRLAQVVKSIVHTAQRRVTVYALDCEDMIGFDAVDTDASPESATNPTCAEALEIDGTLVSQEQSWTVDTTLAPTDDSVADVMPGGRVAYHPGWWKVTTDEDLTIAVRAALAFGNTYMIVLTGTCGGSPSDWVEVVATTVADSPSELSFTCTAGVTYYILVVGDSSIDDGALAFVANLEPL